MQRVLTADTLVSVIKFLSLSLSLLKSIAGGIIINNQEQRSTQLYIFFKKMARPHVQPSFISSHVLIHAEISGTV